MVLNARLVMDELGLAVESIFVKTKKLVFLNKQMQEKISNLEQDLQVRSKRIAQQAQYIAELEDRIVSMQIASGLGKEDSEPARQKVSEMLREIEKCFVLLNR